jgi:hypothetical protein
VIDDATWRERTRDLASRFGFAEPHPDYVGFEARCLEVQPAIAGVPLARDQGLGLAAGAGTADCEVALLQDDRQDVSG